MTTFKLLAGLTGLTALPALFFAGNFPGRSGDDRTFDGAAISNLRVHVPFGDVKVLTGGDRVQVQVKRWLEDKNSATGKRWLAESKLDAQTNGGTLTLTELPFGKKNSNLGSVSFHPHYQLTITLPSSKAVDLGVGAGDVVLTGAYGDLRTHLGAGDIHVSDFTASGRLDLHVGAGDVDVNVGRPLNRASEVQIGTGDLHLRLPVETNAVVEASVGMGEIEGIGRDRKDDDSSAMGAHREATYGKGGAVISLHVGMGSITVNGPTARASRELSEPSAFATLKDNTLALDGTTPPSGHPSEGGEFRPRSEDLEDATDRSLNTLDVEGYDWDQLDKTIDEAVSKSLRLSHVETSKALKDANREAQKGLEEAMAELDRAMEKQKGQLTVRKGELSVDIERIVRKALQQARLATKEALQDVKIEMHDGN